MPRAERIEQWTNKCRGCGNIFKVSDAAIAEVIAEYPESSRHEAANIVEFCEVCAGVTK